MSSVNSSFTLSRKTILISYVTQFFQYGVALLILPLLLNKLSADDIGIWFIFLSVFSLVSLLDFGFSSSIQRSVAYVYSGAETLLKDGFVISDFQTVNLQLLKSLLYTSKVIYKNISLGIFIVSILGGTLYFYLSISDYFTLKFLLTWTLYAFSIAIYFYYSYILSFVKGRGLINQYNLIIIISKSLYVVTLFVLIQLNFGLLSLVIANLVNTVLMVVLGKYFFMDNSIKKVLRSRNILADNLFSIIWKNSKNSGVVSIGVFLLSQAGVFLSNLFLPLNEVAQLGVTLQLYGVLVVLSRVYLTTMIPKVSSLWINDNKNQIKRLFVNSQLFGYLIFLTGTLVIILMGNYILINIVHSNVLLPTNLTLALYGFFYFMEITHGNCCSLISTTNNVPFTKASVFAGVVAILCTIIFVQLNFGIISFPLALVCGSLPYNSWKWPLEVIKLLK